MRHRIPLDIAVKEHKRAIDQLLQLFDRERVQHIHACTRKQRRIDFERRVFGGSADKGEQPAFDIRQESILLRLVETMHLVDE